MSNHPYSSTQKFISARMAALAACAALALQLAAAPAQAQTKMATVDIDAIETRSTSVVNAVNKAEAGLRSDQDKVEAKTKQYQQMAADLKEKQSVMNAADVEAQSAKLTKLKSEIDDMSYSIQKQLDRIKTEVMDPQVKRIMKAITDVAKRENVDLVVRSEAVIYSSDKADITPLVIQALDRESGSGSSATEKSTSSESAPVKATPTPGAARGSRGSTGSSADAPAIPTAARGRAAARGK